MQLNYSKQMTSMLCIFAAVVVFNFAADSASGQQVDLSLQSALDQALQGSPQLAAAEGRIEDALGQKKQAGLKPNPRLTVQSEDIRTSTTAAPFSFANRGPGNRNSRQARAPR